VLAEQAGDQPGDVGAAKLLPVVVTAAPSSQATATSVPGAPNSTGGEGLKTWASLSRRGWAATERMAA
jgi:hypothetical protein